MTDRGAGAPEPTAAARQPLLVPRYRGVQAPISTSNAPHARLQAQPRQQIPSVSGPDDGLVAASKVLRDRLRAWAVVPADATAHLQGATPITLYAGIANVRAQWRDIEPSSNVNVGEKGILYFLGAKRITEHSSERRMVSANLDNAGHFERLSWCPLSTFITYGPIPTGTSLVACGGTKMRWATLTAQGQLSDGCIGFGDFSDSAVTVLEPGVVLKSVGGDLVASHLGNDGKETLVAKATLGTDVGSSSAPAVLGDKVVLLNGKGLRSVRRDGTTFTPLDYLGTGRRFGGDALYPPFISAAGLIVAAIDTNVIVAYAMSPDGKLQARGTFSPGCDVACPVVYRDRIVTAGADGVVRVLATNNNILTQVGSFATGGSITARPTITGDGVVLIGTHTGDVLALQIAADGSLTERHRKNIGEPIAHAVTVLPNGVVLVPGNKSLFALGGP